MNKFFIHIFCFLVLALNSFGQDDYLFNTRHLSVEDGILGRRINTIAQDKNGFIWIATNEGINRFDGYDFQYFTPENSDLQNNNYHYVKLDNNGTLWIDCTERKNSEHRIQLFDTENYTFQFVEEAFPEQTSLINKSSLIKDKNHIFLRTASSKALWYQDGKFKELTYKNRFYPNEITDFYWQNNANQLLKKDFNGKIKKTITLPENSKIHSVIQADNGWFFIRSEDSKWVNKLWLMTEDSIKKISTNKKIVLNNKVAWEKGKLRWITDNQLITYSNPILNQQPNAVFLDNSNTLWIGTSNGLYIVTVQNRNFKTYFKAIDDLGNSYNARGIWANDNYLLSFSPKQAHRLNLKTGEQKPILKSIKDGQGARTYGIADEQHFWISGKSKKLLKYDWIKDKTVKEVVIENSFFAWSIFQDKKGSVWIGGEKGLRYYNPNQTEKAVIFNQYNDVQAPHHPYVIHITADKRNNNLLWLATQVGWYLLDIEKGIQQVYSEDAAANFQLPTSDIHLTYQDDLGVFWLTTAANGLLRVELNADYQVSSVQEFTLKDGLSSNTVYGIFEDDKSYLWLSTNNGIVQFDKTTFTSRFFAEEDGLSHYEFNRGSFFQRDDGTIFFGSLNGIVSFHPDKINKQQPYTIPLKISKCEKLSDKTQQIIDFTSTVLKNNKIIIRPDDRFVSLSVTLQDYFHTPKIKYAYRIKGLQKEFAFAKNNEITLNGLPYGKYQLQIKAQGKDGRYSTEMINIPLIVIKPFYLRWWFISIILLTLFFTVWQILIYRTKALQNRQAELQAIVKDRTTQLSQQANQLRLDKNVITQQADELRSLDEMKSRFFANISHELRTPLTLILSPIRHIIKRKNLDNQDFTAAQLVEQNAQKLLKRINEILDLTKLEAQKVKLKPIPTHLYSYIKILTANFESLAQEKELNIIFNYLLDKDLKIMLDQEKFEHVFNNFLSNAIKFTPQKGKIEIAFAEKTASSSTENQLIFTVKDNGIGIPEEDLPFVFNRFYQAQSNNKNTAASTGIGLALTKEIAQLMQARVRVESEIDKGSTFFFEMPYVEELGSINVPIPQKNINNQNSSIKQYELQASTDNKDQKLVHLSQYKKATQPVILLVEDNAQLRHYIQLILQENYQVVTAKNGKEAIEWLTYPTYDTTSNDKQGLALRENSRQPSLIISDIMMPIMDGFELLQHLKASDKWRSIPVIMLTARTNIKAKLKALQIGVDDYILKPFDNDELITRINNLIKNAANRGIESRTKSLQKSSITITEADTKWLKQVEDRFKSQISNSNYNIEHLLEEFNISRSKAQRRIKKVTGLTPNQYFREIKLQAARELLEGNAIQTVNEVAYAVGFDSAKYFSKIYTERFGKRPIEYLR